MLRITDLSVHYGRVRLIFDTSTGSGEYYTSGGVRKHAVTPRGTFRVFRAVNGWDSGPLGRLYRPRYFNGGIAVHGYPSVPFYPGSHGCVRLPVWLAAALPVPQGAPRRHRTADRPGPSAARSRPRSSSSR